MRKLFPEQTDFDAFGVAICAFVLGACGDEGKEDSGDTGTAATTGATTGATTTGTTIPATEIDVVIFPSCDDADAIWTYHAETVGWTDGNNLVNAWETGSVGGWSEEHTLPSIEFGDNYAWDILERTLTDQAEVVDYTPDTNTVFTCGIHDVEDNMTFAIRVYDFDGNFADCAIFASDPTGIQAVNDGSAPDQNPPSNASELDSCVEWTVN